ncbi:hypothetical protein [Archangium sp.]|uniref:hypothetical protein n=1 Tax=Archangium sp. TaxID=1872627 RepID=UPI002ED89F70
MFLLTAAYPEAGGPSTTVQLTVDKTPPTFVVTVSPADAGVATDGGATYGDPSLANAWRRDQVVPVEIRTNEPNLDPTSLTVALRGTDGGIAPTVGVTSLTGACDAGFCGVAQLKLWEPALDDFRAALPIIVQGRDRAGNVGSTSATSVNVTRWKWVFDASSGGIFSIKSAPAIGAQGVVYVGTAAASTGKVFAIEAEGARKWESSVGAVTGGLVVGAPNGATELVYVGANGTSSGDLYALQGDDGGTRQRCPFGPGSFAGVLALGSTTAAQLETAVSVYNGSSAAVIAGIRPGSGSPCPQTESPSTGEQIPQITSGSPVVMQNDNIFFSGPGTMTFKVTSYTFGVGSPRSNWPVDVAHAPRSLALVGTDVVGAAASTDFFAGGLFKVPQVGATSVTRLFPASTPWSSRVFSFAVGSGENVFFGAEPTASAEFNRLNLSTLAVQTSASGAAIRATPITGRNGTVYTITTTGIVRAWDADGPSPRWTLSPALGTVDASPTIDCPRDATGAFVEGNHGVLYVPAGGKLYAFVVDSRGLDPNAPWPKFQHDARNTGNPATPITSCP